MSIVKFALMAIVMVMLVVKVKSIVPVYGIYLSMALSIFMAFFLISKLEIVIEAIDRLADLVNVDKLYINIMFKLIGIAIICEIATNMLSDAGQKGVATEVEMAGKLTMITISMPILFAIVDTINSMWG